MPTGSIGVNLSRSLDKVRAQLKTNPKLWKELNAFLR